MEIEREARAEDSETDSSVVTNSSDEDSSDDDDEMDRPAPIEGAPEAATVAGIVPIDAATGPHHDSPNPPPPPPDSKDGGSRRGSRDSIGAAAAAAAPPRHSVITATVLAGGDGRALPTSMGELEPHVTLRLKSLIANARSAASADILRAGELAAATQTEARVNVLHETLTSRPGSTWADYSARRLVTRQREEFKPTAEQFQFLPECDSERWGVVAVGQLKYEEQLRVLLEQELRAAKRLRSGDSTGTEDVGERPKRRRRDRVYKCRRVKSGCVAVFASKEERDEHYAKVHNFVRTGGDDKKLLRCPLVNCDHRYPTKPRLERHILEAHSKFVEVLDVALLVKTVANRMKKTSRPWESPFHGDDTQHEDAAALEDHMEKEHPAFKVKLLRARERKKLLRRRVEKQRLLEQLAREREEAIEAARLARIKLKQGYSWKAEDLEALEAGTLVWARYRDYPFWPGLVDNNFLVGETRKMSIYFLGDETCETVVNFDKNLRPFRCSKHAKFVEAGKQHALKVYFERALEQAAREERRIKAGKGGLAGPAAAEEPTIDAPTLRRLARRAGQDKPLEKSFKWSGRRLRQIKSGVLVWVRLRSYPFWPARVEVVEAYDKGQTPTVTCQFFGDNAWERVKNINDNLRLFRDGKFEFYARAGIAHRHGGTAHREAVAEAVTYETASVASVTENAATVVPEGKGKAADADVPRWYPQKKGKKGGTGKSAPVESKGPGEAPKPKKMSAAERELGNLVFGAPGRKAQITAGGEELSAREKRKLQRALELTKAADAAAEARKIKVPTGGRRERFDMESRFPIRDIVTDFFAVPTPEEAANGGAVDVPQGPVVDDKSSGDRPRKLARPRRQRKPGLVYQHSRTIKQQVTFPIAHSVA